MFDRNKAPARTGTLQYEVCAVLHPIIKAVDSWLRARH
jgi:hypothetical protein